MIPALYLTRPNGLLEPYAQCRIPPYAHGQPRDCRISLISHEKPEDWRDDARSMAESLSATHDRGALKSRAQDFPIHKAAGR